MGDRTADLLADYADSLSYDDLSAEVVHQVKRLTIDSLGCALGAYLSEPAKIVREVACLSTGPFTATILGSRRETTPDMASLANGTMVRYLDLNDAYTGRDTCHPSDNIAPALAAGEAYGALGEDFITAAVLGYEVQCRFAEAHMLADGGPWDQAVYSTISAALAAGKVIGLTRKELGQAIRLSIVSNLSLVEARRGELPMWKASLTANAGRNAIIAALLASKGMTGPDRVFEGPYGLFRAVSGSKPIPLEQLGGDGQPFLITESRIKRFPAGFYSQTAIEAAIECREALGITSPEQVGSARVKTFEAGKRVMAGDREKWRPTTRETADHSMPYVVAVALARGTVGPEHFSDEALADQSVASLMSRIAVDRDPECDAAWPDAILNIVEVATRDGRRHVARVPYHKGHAKRPLNDSEVEDKFRRLATPLLTASQQDMALETAWDLDGLDDLTDLMSALVV